MEERGSVDLHAWDLPGNLRWRALGATLPHGQSGTRNPGEDTTGSGGLKYVW